MLTLIADVHGKYDKYLDICRDNEFTLQLGDMGYNYTPLNELDSSKHKFIFGNHDLHNIEKFPPHYLGKFGTALLGGVEFFFVSGAFSIDWKIRRAKYLMGEWSQTWFENEELSYSEGLQCLEMYAKLKPDVLFTHEAPRFWADKIGNPNVLKSFGYDPESFTTSTSVLLDQMFKEHRPKLFVCGHYHKNYHEVIDGTNMFVLGELCTLEI